MGRDRGTVVAWRIMSADTLVVRPLRPPWRIIQPPELHGDDHKEKEAKGGLVVVRHSIHILHGTFKLWGIAIEVVNV